MAPSNVDRVGRLDGQDGGLRYFVLDKAKSAMFSSCCIDLERQFLDGSESTESLADVVFCCFKGYRSDINPAEGLALLRNIGDGERRLWFRC
jgi:hypothetical protein